MRLGIVILGNDKSRPWNQGNDQGE